MHTQQGLTRYVRMYVSMYGWGVGDSLLGLLKEKYLLGLLKEKHLLELLNEKAQKS